MWNENVASEKKRALKERAIPAISKEEHYGNKDEAVKNALEQCRNLDELISVWKAPDGRFAIIHHENREKAANCDYKEVVDTGELFDAVKEKIDDIDEI